MQLMENIFFTMFSGSQRLYHEEIVNFHHTGDNSEDGMDYNDDDDVVDPVYEPLLEDNMKIYV